MPFTRGGPMPEDGAEDGAGGVSADGGGRDRGDGRFRNHYREGVVAKKKAAKSDSSRSDSVEVAAEAAATFEESLAEVEGIVRELESGRLKLGDSLRAYERGVRELRLCHEHLEKVERRIELLIGFDEQGRPVTEAFESESMTLEEKQTARGRRRGAGGASRASEASETAADSEDSVDSDEPAGRSRSPQSRVDDSLGLF